MEFRLFILKFKSFVVFPAKIDIRKLLTIVGSFRIRIFHCKTYIFLYFATYNPNTDVFRLFIVKHIFFGDLPSKIIIRKLPTIGFSIAKRMIFGVLHAKFQIQILPTFIDSFLIRVFHCKTHIFWYFATKIQIRKLPTIVGSFRIRVFHIKPHFFWCFAG